ncbi:MAG: DUF2779 domain-containing protein [Bacilli bacterium]|nr:DUF2779 domain-containing protein [Bacilli bacterium]
MISKSTFVRFMHCSKDLWLFFSKKEEMAPLDAVQKQNIKNGIIVGGLARKYFPDTLNAQTTTPNGFPIYEQQIEITKKCLADNANCIAEASFSYKNLFCAVDLLKKDDDGYSIYEVKSNKEVEDEHYYDVAFQKYVLEKCGLKINHIYLMHVNFEYVRHGELDLSQYFALECLDTNSTVLTTYNEMDNYLSLIDELLNSKEEPVTVFENGKCNKKDCPFYCYCHKDIPDKSILLLNGRGLKGKEELLAKGIITIDDLVCSGLPVKGNLNRVQIDCIRNNKQVSVDKNGLSKFLSSLKYPIYHLDFETTNYIVPPFDGMRPHEEFPFQYSLHIEDKPGHLLAHREFLANKLDCIKEIAKSLYDDIPDGATVLAYYASVEQRFIRYLASKCPEYSERLLSYKVVDLYQPFANGYYYNIAQGASCSIKQVMPAIVPEHANAYQELPGVHNGAEALSIFDIMLHQDDNVRQITRKGMLEYCKLDTLSMVWVLNKLWSIIGH